MKVDISTVRPRVHQRLEQRVDGGLWCPAPACGVGLDAKD
jgi:hypothetical protein